MVPTVSQSPTLEPTYPHVGSIAKPDTPIIAADVGGTFARVALVSLDGGPLRLRSLRRYACADYPSLAAILGDFRAEHASDITTAVVAIAGILQGDSLLNANLPWPVSVRASAEQAGLERLTLLNDFEAVAHAIPYLRLDSLSALNGIAARAPSWPALVIGPGTGLGAALRLADQHAPVLASEAGHAALTPGTPLELEILGQLMQRWPHVDAERVLSGSGLMQLYPCLCELRGTTPRWHDTTQLIRAAHTGADALAVETLQVFCGWLGSVCGDLTVTFGARSVYLAGGISDHIAPLLSAGGFRQRFRNKGVLSTVLTQVPVWRVEHEALGVLGAAAWCQWQRALR